jgi:hypothetical protein
MVLPFRITNTLGETVDKNPVAEVTGIYQGPDGVRTFIKAERPVPPNYKLVDKVRRLNDRAEVRAASDDAEPEAKPAKGGRKSAKKSDPDAIENKMDDVDADKADDDADDGEE